MSKAAPFVDARTAAELREEIIENLLVSVPEWSPIDAAGEPDQASAALISIAARFGEIAIQRLNQAPNKNFLAFLDMLGAARLPPEPARAPLTFTLASGSVTDALVPAGTQVAALPAPGDAESVIFETDRELTAVAANLKMLMAVNADRDLLGDHSALLTAPANDGKRVFNGNRLNEHVLYVAYSGYLAHERLATLTLTFQMHAQTPAAPDVRVLQWEVWDGVNGIPLTVVDSTQDLRVTGQVTFTNLQQFSLQTVSGIRGRWLRCRLLTPISPGTNNAQGMVRAAQLPLLADIQASAVINRTGLIPEAAFSNAQALDVSRAFLPFGDKPLIGDAFYLGQREALGQPGAAITLALTLVNPLPDGSGPPPSSDLKLRWETWNGAAWQLLGETTREGSVGGIVDGTKAFTKSGTVTFNLPATLAPTTVNGVEGHWIRVHIVAGNYGLDAFYQQDPTAPGGFRLVNATFRPPLVSTLALSYNVTTPSATPDAVVAFNNAQFEDLGAALTAHNAAPFAALPPQPPALYAAFTLPPGRKSFPNRSISLYHGVRLPPYGERITPLTPDLSVQSATPGSTAQHSFILTNIGADSLACDLAIVGGAWVSLTDRSSPFNLPPRSSTQIIVTVAVPSAGALPGANASDRGFLQLRTSADEQVHSVTFETRVGEVAPRRRELRYEYWNGAGWAKLVTADGTDRLTRPGVVEILGPADFLPSEQFGVRAYWMRALFEAGDDPSAQLRTLLLNTTFASQAVTLRNEVLGSSDAAADLSFQATRAPVLANPQLDVRESDVWVRWTQVADFHGSTSEDRHYVLDHISGRVTFGDGVRGHIPPRGIGNVRMRLYQTGGGRSGNRAAGTIVQLKTTVPYIERVSNVEPATGGIAAETNEALIVRAPRTLRHGGRAVTLQDYEDLARSASPEVARAKSVPLRRLQDAPLSSVKAPGSISVIIVPDSIDAKPLPSSGLTELVASRLRAQATPTAELAVVGPLYVRVDVSIEVALSVLEGAGAVEQAVRDVLQRFLHPLTGGRNGAGWDFGRQPHLSDLHAVVSEVAGVDHIRGLSFSEIEEPPGALATGRFLVYSGQHQVTLSFVGAE
jgi:hypothetical protein